MLTRVADVSGFEEDVERYHLQIYFGDISSDDSSVDVQALRRRVHGRWASWASSAY